MLASRSEDPREILLTSDAGEGYPPFDGKRSCGFYWTEGLRGLGWAVDAVPTLKGGSTVGIPSPPAIWNPLDGSISTPEIRDAERLQGFEPDWTLPAIGERSVRKGHRWKLVGNAVSVRVARWVGERLTQPERYTDTGDRLLARGVSWPKAAWGRKGKVYAVDRSTWPVREPAQHLTKFLRYPTTLLSARATSGFFGRAQVSGLYFEPGFLEDVERHADRMSREATVA
jgi:DNA (cytosine-5)-methyltransferase 1